MAVSVVAPGTFISAAATSISPAVPASANLLVNDILVALADHNSNTVITFPTGYATILTINNGTARQLTVAWKRVTSVETAAAWTKSDATAMSGRVIQLRGTITTGDPFEVKGAGGLNGTVATTANTCPAITTLTANAMVMMFANGSVDGASTTTFSGWTTPGTGALTEGGDNGSAIGLGTSQGFAYALKATAGTTGAGSVTMVSSTICTSVLVSITAAPPPAPGAPTIQSQTNGFAEAISAAYTPGTNQSQVLVYYISADGTVVDANAPLVNTMVNTTTAWWDGEAINSGNSELGVKLPPVDRYALRLKSTNASGTSAFAGAGVYTYTRPRPGASLVASALASGGAVQLQFNQPLFYAAQAKVYRSDTVNTATVPIGEAHFAADPSYPTRSLTNTWIDDGGGLGLVAGRVYTYTFRWKADGVRLGAASTSVTATPTAVVVPTTPTAPRHVGAEPDTVLRIRVLWQPKLYAAVYRIYRNGVLIGTTASGFVSTFVDSSTLVLGTSYSYTVRAVTTNESPDSTAFACVCENSVILHPKSDAPDLPTRTIAYGGVFSQRFGLVTSYWENIGTKAWGYVDNSDNENGVYFFAAFNHDTVGETGGGGGYVRVSCPISQSPIPSDQVPDTGVALGFHVRWPYGPTRFNQFGGIGLYNESEDASATAVQLLTGPPQVNNVTVVAPDPRAHDPYLARTSFVDVGFTYPANTQTWKTFIVDPYFYKWLPVYGSLGRGPASTHYDIQLSVAASNVSGEESAAFYAMNVAIKIPLKTAGPAPANPIQRVPYRGASPNTPYDQSNFDLGWDAVAGASSYEVYQSNGTLLGTVTSNGFVVYVAPAPTFGSLHPLQGAYVVALDAAGQKGQKGFFPDLYTWPDGWNTVPAWMPGGAGKIDLGVSYTPATYYPAEPLAKWRWMRSAVSVAAATVPVHDSGQTERNWQDTGLVDGQTYYYDVAVLGGTVIGNPYRNSAYGNVVIAIWEVKAGPYVDFTATSTTTQTGVTISNSADATKTTPEAIWAGPAIANRPNAANSLNTRQNVTATATTSVLAVVMTQQGTFPAGATRLDTYVYIDTVDTYYNNNLAMEILQSGTVIATRGTKATVQDNTNSILARRSFKLTAAETALIDGTPLTIRITSTYTGTVTAGAIDVYGARIRSAYTPAGGFVAPLVLAGSSAGQAAVTGNLGKRLALAGTPVGVGSDMANLVTTHSQPLAGTPRGVATGTGAIKERHALAGTSAGVGVVTANLINTKAGLVLAGTAAGQAAATGVVKMRIALRATATGVATVTARTRVPLRGAVAGTGSMTGRINLTAKLTATSAGQAAVVGALGLVTRLAAVVSGVAGGQANLRVQVGNGTPVVTEANKDRFEGRRKSKRTPLIGRS